MRAGIRERVRVEEGAISVSALIGIALVLFVGYLLLAAFEGDSAQFGSVPVPGKEQVELPKGDVDIYYSEKVDPDAGVPLITPDDLQYTVTGPDGQGVTVNSRGDDAEVDRGRDDAADRVVAGARGRPLHGRRPRAPRRRSGSRRR